MEQVLPNKHNMIGRPKQDDGQVIFVNLRNKNEAKEKVKPFFTFSKKIDGAWAVFAENTRFSGHLRKLTVGEREFNLGGGKVEKKPEVTIQLYDEELSETYVLRLPIRISSRSLFNRILNLQSMENLEISVWEDDKNFEVLSLKQNDENVKQRFTKEEVPAAPKVKVNGAEISDTYELNKFYLEKLTEFGAALTHPVKKTVPASRAAAEDEDTNPVYSDDDVPF